MKIRKQESKKARKQESEKTRKQENKKAKSAVLADKKAEEMTNFPMTNDQ